MLELINIRKTYGKDEAAVEALKGVSLKFRESEFVSVLGQSGCGKTTLLNIIGGLDQYTSGDLIINNTSTKDYTDSDWDTYRNHSIGFIFQSYNLISHQTVLANVELALTLSGISKNERRKRAVQALDKVGLRSQMNKRPNQLSGGQMQRVAIARALINNPDILLADEPTGALDSETSVQVMELLKEIAKDRLVIMVTHNPELAEEYSTRIINLRDGNLVGDSDPYDGKMEMEEFYQMQEKKNSVKRKKKASMSFWTAMSLSFNNLMTKKGRTFLTSFAGSIGIIGIALILAVSTGVNAYIKSIEESTMSSYPLQIMQNTMDPTTMMASMMQAAESSNQKREPGKVYSSQIMSQMMTMMVDSTATNNLEKFKDFLDSNKEIQDLVTDIKYDYSPNWNIYLQLEDGSYRNSSQGLEQMYSSMGVTGTSQEMMLGMSTMMGSSMGSVTGWTELIGDLSHLQSEYELVDGKYPESSNEIVLIVDESNQISDYTLYVLGIRDFSEIQEYMEAAIKAQLTGDKVDIDIPATDYTYEEIYDFDFKVLLDSDHYALDGDKIVKLTDDDKGFKQRLDSAMELKIVGIVRPTDDTMNMANIGTIGYLSSLKDEVIHKSNNSAVVKAQLKNPDVDMFTGIRFDSEGYTMDDFPMIKEILQKHPGIDTTFIIDALVEQLNMPYLKDIILEYVPTSAESLMNMIIKHLNENRITSNTYKGNLEALGYIDIENPTSISIYPKDFEAKERINEIIAEYNNQQNEDDKIIYSDTVALLMSSVTTIIDAISYVLIAFVAISLVVSSIMIGIITYISVLERTKEIGILRAIGASKKDIARVFNAETLFVGFVAGMLGIICSLGLIVIINIILYHFTGIANLQAVLEPIPAIILVAISMGLTFIAGLFPSKTASKKDPVIALRTE
ncbi:MAG: ABC transporter ATP-binding protein/permease [Clostridia bacterium]|nr:ABC transporter ATP-binding protein/permease [Clostridia bacterium]